MPGPTEEQALRALLESLVQESSANEKLVFQKRILGAVAVAIVAAVVLLLFLSGLCGAAALGFIMLTQVHFQTGLLRPFVDLDALRRRIDELQAS